MTQKTLFSSSAPLALTRRQLMQRTALGTGAPAPQPRPLTDDQVPAPGPPKDEIAGCA